MALFRTREGLRASGDTITARRSSVTPRLEWLSPAERVTVAAQRGPWVRTDGPSLEAVVNDLQARVKPAVVSAFRRHFLPIPIRAFDAWPVDTGYSKSRLESRVEQRDDSFGILITNDAPYVGQIWGGRFVNVWLFTPVRRAVPRAARMIGKGVANG